MNWKETSFDEIERRKKRIKIVVKSNCCEISKTNFNSK